MKGSMHLRRLSSGLWTAVCLLLASPVSAQADPEGRPAPYVAGEVTLEFQLDHDTGRGSSGLRRTTAEASADAEVGLWLSPVVSVQSDITLDSTDNRLSDENLVFGEAGLRAQELYLQLDFDMLRVFAGKFEVDFGVAWDDAYGIYGTDLAEEYELTERIGVGAEVQLADTALGTHKLSGSVFFADTTFLSGNLINGNDRLRRSDGGVGNTEYPSSFSLAAHGTGFILPSDVHYHAAFSYLPAGRGDPQDQLGLSFALAGEWLWTEDLSFEWLSEVVHLFHADGGNDDRTYFTASGKLTRGHVWLAPTVTQRFGKITGGTNADATLGTVSVGYDFDFGLTLSAGVRLFDETESDSALIGFKAEYKHGF